mmetsp:Transcript_3500/g.6628  ORF Transcript_3500/g.6628 Transcript_3500/m.6628 type:complete len:198 (+) Transcript_3500:79-672(+)|eukprot:CAMPEP_0175143284 /NCGR_PEP_ID=MMETSP0087-20121206/13335_1 /TAXON_ID=136419 /ORGANISM="Unknown Unknown, Strain D1" /LENGTH=197 /DNA_ID=CAMNT_0016427313 /DNA_START=77 /DNA_END=670 /DNA_ORIENTATION=+
MYGDVAIALLKELKRSTTGLPPHNDDSMRKIIREIEAVYKVMLQTLRANNFQVDDPSIACGLVVHHTSLIRNKRCALAYLSNRLAKIIELWWEAGSVVPEELKSCLSNNEAVFYEEYDKLISEYQAAVDVDLSQDPEPPKEVWIEVRVLKDHGTILTDDGEISLKKHEQMFLRRSDSELLIRQGILKLIDAKEDKSV